MLKAAYIAIKETDKNATVLGDSLAGADTFYLKALYDLAAKGLFDALAIHPYTAVTDTGSVDGPRDFTKPPWCFEQGINAIRRLMVDVYGDDKPVWVTEFGVSSFNGWGGISEQQQALFLREAFSILQQWKFVPVFIRFNLIDQDAQTTRDGGFGLYRSNFILKPVGDEFRSLVAALEQQTDTEPVLVSPIGTHSGKSTVFLWRSLPGANR